MKTALLFGSTGLVGGYVLNYLIQNSNYSKIKLFVRSFIEINDPKIFGALVAVIVGYFSKNIIATILAGLFSYWFLIFLIFN